MVFFVLAVLVLSRTIGASNVFLAEQDMASAGKLIGWLGALAFTVFMLAFQMYRLEKAKGNVKIPVALFERVMRRHRARKPASGKGARS